MPIHVIKKNATTADTLRLIVAAINVYEHSPFVIRITKALNPTGDKYAFIKRVFDYVCKNVRYQLDPEGNEHVWSPELTVQKGYGDCKKITTLIGSILKCAGIEPVPKHVYYKDADHTHIYITVPFPTLQNYLTVDPVNEKQWNKEVAHDRAALYLLNGQKMDLHLMGNTNRPHEPNQPNMMRFKANWGARTVHQSARGIDDDINGLAGMGCPTTGREKESVLMQSLSGDFNINGIDDDVIQGIGKGKRSKSEKKEHRKARRKKLFHVFKAVNLAPMRASFLTLVRLNAFRLANRMAKVWIHDPTALIKLWEKWGGKPDVLKKTIKQGAWPSIRKQITGVDDSVVSGLAGIGFIAGGVGALEAMEGIGFPPAVVAAITAATPIILAVVGIIGKSKHDQDKGDAPDTEGSSDSADEDSSDQESTSGIGWSGQDDIIYGIGAYDYVDGMGRKRKKKKKSSGEKEHKKKVKITDDDVKIFSTLAEYGTKKILDGKVTTKQMNEIPHDDDGGTKDTPILPPEDKTPEAQDHVSKMVTTATATDVQIPPPPTAGSFGLTEINNLADFLHWFKGALMLSFMGAIGLTILNDIIIVGSFLYLIRTHIFSFTKKLFTQKK